MTTNIPQIPKNISSDGHEIWSWGKALLEYIHRTDKISDLQNKIKEMGTKCGHCDKWLKSDICPKEYHVNGRLRGPSCETLKCNKFIEVSWITDYRVELETELQNLRREDAEDKD